MQRYRSGHNGADSKSVWEQSHEGSNPSRCATSEQSPLCSDVFLCQRQKDVIRPLPCSSFPTATRCAELAVGGPPCGGSVPLRGNIDFDRPFQLVASVTSLATSFFVSLQSSSRAHWRCSSRPNCSRSRWGAADVICPPVVLWALQGLWTCVSVPSGDRSG